MPRLRLLTPQEQAQLAPKRPGRKPAKNPKTLPRLVPDVPAGLHPVIAETIALQQAQGLTDKELAYRLGIAPELWRRLRQAKSQPTEATLRYLAQRLPTVAATPIPEAQPQRSRR